METPLGIEPAPHAAPLLSVEGLRVSFRVEGEVLEAVRGVDLSVQPGETLAIVGESGSGKSATMTSIVGLLAQNGQVEADRISFMGEEVDPGSDRMRDLRGRRIGFVFQDPQSSLNPVLTIGRQMTEHILRHLGISRSAATERAASLLAQVGLPNPSRALASYPFEFSGGMRQRISLASSLMCSPSLLIADEPTTALDVTIQAQILDLLIRLRDETGIGIIFITHDLSVASLVADRIAVMYAGQIVEEAATVNLQDLPTHPYTRGLLASMPSIEDPTIPVGIPGSPPDLDSVPDGCAFGPRCDGFERGRCDDRQRLEVVQGTHWVRCDRWADLLPVVVGR